MSELSITLSIGLLLSFTYSVYLTFKLEDVENYLQVLSNRVLTLESKNRKIKFDIGVLNSLIMAEKQKMRK